MPSSGDIIFAADYAVVLNASFNKPVVRLVQSVTQSLTNATATAITFTSESIDTDNFFNTGTSTTRITPNKAGTYRCRGVVWLPAALTYSVCSAWIRLNGTGNVAPAGRLGGLGFQGAPASAPTAQIVNVDCECLLTMNGTTDYIELICQQTNTAAAAQSTNVSSQYSSAFEVEFVRGP